MFTKLLFLIVFVQSGQNGPLLVTPLSLIEELETELKDNPVDPSSFSRPDRVRVTHIKWKAFVNFEEQIIEGTVDLTVDKLVNTSKLILDSSKLTITKITDKETNQKLKFKLSPEVKIFGSKLTIQLLVNNRSTVSISYKTSPNATALQWLKPEQTSGKKQPYLFSQCAPIHCRSLLPCQDSPSTKATYEAVVSILSKSLYFILKSLSYRINR